MNRKTKLVILVLLVVLVLSMTASSCNPPVKEEAKQTLEQICRALRASLTYCRNNPRDSCCKGWVDIGYPTPTGSGDGK